MEKRTFILSDQTVNSYGYIVLTSGISLDFFKKNPVMLLNHNPDKIMGRWENIRVDGTRLLADASFDEKDPEALKMYEKVEQNMLNCTSIGFQITDVTYGIDGYENYPVIIECSLKEASLTPIPANESAIRLYDRDGQLLSNDQVLTLLSKNNQSMKKLSFFIAALNAAGINLAADASEDDVLKAVQKVTKEHADLTSEKTELEGKVNTLNGKVKTLEDAATAAETSKIEALVDGAITAKKLTADKRDQYIKLAKADFDTTKSILDSARPYTSLSATIEGNKGGDGADPFAGWDFKRLHREAPDELARIKANDKARYDQLFAAAYSKKG